MWAFKKGLLLGKSASSFVLECVLCSGVPELVPNLRNKPGTSSDLKMAGTERNGTTFLGLKIVPLRKWSFRHFCKHFNSVPGCCGSFINQWCVISKYLELVPKFYTVAPLKRVCKALPQQLLLSQDLLRLTSAHWNMQNWANIYCYSVKWAGTKWNKSIFTGTIWNEFCMEERGTELERNEFQLRIM